ncbi:MAG: 2-hydroxyacid dehydrogenase [Bdellovibrionales bacterium]
MTIETISGSKGFSAVSIFVNDQIDKDALEGLKKNGVKKILLRCAGHNNVDLKIAKELGIQVYRVPEYSPYAVAEFATSLLMTLNRKTHKAYNRVRESNFSIEGLTGFDLHGKTIGLIGLGKIGTAFANIMQGFGCKILFYDPGLNQSPNKNWKQVELNHLISNSKVISLHCPLTKDNHHLIGEEEFALMDPNSFLINTGRGALIDSKALIQALKTKQIAGAALDVYEEEQDIFFHDCSQEGISDDVLSRLTSFPNVLVTSHQAFLTHEALKQIAKITHENYLAKSEVKQNPNRLV